MSIIVKRRNGEKEKLKLDSTPRYLWHMTWHKSLKSDVELLRPILKGAHRGEDEPLLARICTSIYSGGGFCAVPEDRDYKAYRLYRTAKKVYSYHPLDVHDRLATGERWLLTPTMFILQRTFTQDEYAAIMREAQKETGFGTIWHGSFSSDEHNLRCQTAARRRVTRKLDNGALWV